MPRLSVYFLRASLIYLVLGFFIGGLLLANKGILISPHIWILLPIHIEFVFIGWIVQLAIGIAYWILPRFSGSHPRGDERWSWAAIWFLNAGIFLAILQVFSGIQWLLILGRFLELTGIVAFALGNWKRVKPSGG